MKYVFVESFSAYNFAKKKIKQKKICWISSSPKVCNFFLLNKIHCIQIETLATNQELDDIAKISKKICDVIISKSKTLIEKKYFDLRFVAGIEIFHTIHSLIYKTYLLNQILKVVNKKIICVGNSNLSNIDFFRLGVFDNIFAFLGNQFKKKIIFIEYKEKSDPNIEKLIHGHNNFFFTKVVSFLNANFSTALYKVFNNLKILQKILNRGNRKQILIMKETDHISNSFYELLKKFNIVFFNINLKDIEKKIRIKKNQILNDKFSKSYIDFNLKSASFLNNSTLKKTELISYQKGLSTITLKIFQNLQSIDENFFYIEKKLDKIISKYNKDFYILSNNALSYFQSIFALYCQSKGIKFFSFEHGLRGLSEIDRSNKHYYTQYKANYGVFYWKKSVQYSHPSIHQKKIIAGFPCSLKNKSFKFYLKKILIKISFRLSFFKKTIVFLSDLERNNSNFPKFTNDYNIVKNNKKIISFLARQYPQKIIILKLYSTQRYLDIYNYEDLAKSFKNVRVLRDISFDYLIDAFDEIYLSHASSTLLKCISSNADVYFLKMKNNTDLIKPFIKRKVKINIKSLDSSYLLKKNYSKISNKWINYLK